MADHVADCRWERTTPAECEYRETHHYCPHPEHACSCPRVPLSTEPPQFVDDPEMDATDGAHPAWWRGCDYGVEQVCRIIGAVLDGDPGPHHFGSAKLTEVVARVAALAAPSSDA